MTQTLEPKEIPCRTCEGTGRRGITGDPPKVHTRLETVKWGDGIRQIDVPFPPRWDITDITDITDLTCPTCKGSKVQHLPVCPHCNRIHCANPGDTICVVCEGYKADGDTDGYEVEDCCDDDD